MTKSRTFLITEMLTRGSVEGRGEMQGRVDTVTQSLSYSFLMEYFFVINIQRYC